ncbi:MAG: response regulator [Deltaproteobacteria bacterium]|jgi:DNA-binding response OmpR family regulator
MENTHTVEEKKALVVDDEIDVLESLEELLEDDFMVDTASSFEEAVSCLKKATYDVAILDIMGVRGYVLLEATKKKQIPTLMLTAHAFSPDNLKKSIELGADAYIPKDKMVDIAMYVDDVLTSHKNKRENTVKWYAKLQPLYDEVFGNGWKDSEKEFWEDFDKKYLE